MVSALIMISNITFMILLFHLCHVATAILKNRFKMLSFYHNICCFIDISLLSTSKCVRVLLLCYLFSIKRVQVTTKSCSCLTETVELIIESNTFGLVTQRPRGMTSVCAIWLGWRMWSRIDAGRAHLIDGKCVAA